MAAVAAKQRKSAATASASRTRPASPSSTAVAETLETKSRPASRPDGPSDIAAVDIAAHDIAAPLLGWYDRERRELPWRYAPGEPADPYRVWLSEIMLQQTTVKAVVPYFERFVLRWPDVRALAAAREEHVLQMWAGLGYYSRARNLHACAKAVAARSGAAFPRTETELLDLPGIGPYTAAAIASIAFGERAAPVDGNIERITARLFAVTDPLPTAKSQLRRLAATLTPADRSGDFAQALMDLGAGICTPKRPSCLMCPINRACRARALGLAEDLPARAAKPERPVRRGVAFLALSEDGRVLLRRRPGSGLLASMMEIPSTDWVDVKSAVPPSSDHRAGKSVTRPPNAGGRGPTSKAADRDPASRDIRRDVLDAAPVSAEWYPVAGLVEHTFTHFKLELEVLRALVPADASLTLWAEPDRCRWVPRGRLKDQALPSLMRKVIAHGLKG